VRCWVVLLAAVLTVRFVHGTEKAQRTEFPRQGMGSMTMLLGEFDRSAVAAAGPRVRQWWRVVAGVVERRVEQATDFPKCRLHASTSTHFHSGECVGLPQGLPSTLKNFL
jgi:hypothetical protein